MKIRNNAYLVLGMASLLGLTSCDQIFGKKEVEAPQAPPVMPVTVIDAQPVEHVVRVNLPGRLEPFRQAEVRARVSGILLKRTYEEGQDVKQGDLLFQIDPAPYEAIRDAAVAAVLRAEANLANIQDKERRYRPLAEKGSVSESDHTDLVLREKMAVAELAAAKAELTKAELELDYTKVTSPITGRARAELVTEGALVGHGTATPLTTVEQLDPIYVKFTQPAAEINAIMRGVKRDGWKKLNLDDIEVTIILDDGQPYPEKGKIVFNDLAVDRETDNVQMKAAFPNKNKELLPGAYVRVEFDRAIREAVYMIPRVAVTKTQDSFIVLVVNKDNVVEPRPVQTSELEGDNWIVTGGLNPGDKVIVGKHMLIVNPGSKVIIEKVLNEKSANTDEAKSE